jgi:hypothetical protein
MKMNKIAIFIVLISALACKNTETKKGFTWEDCKFGKPEPIFGENNLPGVKSKTFAITKSEGLEVVNFSDSLKTELSIRQSGCDELQQEFTFTYTGKAFSTWDDEQWKQQTALEFIKFSKMSPRLFPYSNWAKAVFEQHDDIRIGEIIELAPGHSMKINKMAQADQGQMIVTLIGKRE